MGHLDPTAEHKSPQLPCTLACYGVQWRQQLLAFVLGFSLPHPHSFLSSPPYDILLFFLPYLTKVERGKKRGKHPEGGGGGKEEKENKDEKTKMKDISEPMGRAGFLLALFLSITELVSVVCTSSWRLTELFFVTVSPPSVTFEKIRCPTVRTSMLALSIPVPPRAGSRFRKDSKPEGKTKPP